MTFERELVAGLRKREEAYGERYCGKVDGLPRTIATGPGTLSEPPLSDPLIGFCLTFSCLDVQLLCGVPGHVGTWATLPERSIRPRWSMGHFAQRAISG